MRLPKRGFNNVAFAVKYSVVTLKQIEEKFTADSVVDRDSLIVAGLLSGANKSLDIKIIGNTELSKKINFVGVSKFSATAKKIIEAKNGKIS
jgi:large subunit ribosomal protein L15